MCTKIPQCQVNGEKMFVCVWERETVPSDAECFATGWLKHIGQFVVTISDSLLNLFHSTTWWNKGPGGKGKWLNGWGRAHTLTHSYTFVHLSLWGILMKVCSNLPWLCKTLWLNQNVLTVQMNSAPDYVAHEEFKIKSELCIYRSEKPLSHQTGWWVTEMPATTVRWNTQIGWRGHISCQTLEFRSLRCLYSGGNATKQNPDVPEVVKCLKHWCVIPRPKQKPCLISVALKEQPPVTMSHSFLLWSLHLRGGHRGLLFADKACVENRPASGIPGANY